MFGQEFAVFQIVLFTTQAIVLCGLSYVIVSETMAGIRQTFGVIQKQAEIEEVEVEVLPMTDGYGARPSQWGSGRPGEPAALIATSVRSQDARPAHPAIVPESAWRRSLTILR